MRARAATLRVIVRLMLPAAALAACTPTGRPAATVAAAAPMVPGTVTIWRGVKVLPGTTHIDWSEASFGVSGGNPSLSFFDAQGNDRPCWLRVTVDAPNVPVVKGQGGTVTLTIPMAVPPDPQGAPSPWAATFDDEPAGHWSIYKTAIVPAHNPPYFNKVAGRVAGSVFRASALAGQVAVVDGTVAGCQI